MSNKPRVLRVCHARAKLEGSIKLLDLENQNMFPPQTSITHHQADKKVIILNWRKVCMPTEQ